MKLPISGFTMRDGVEEVDPKDDDEYAEGDEDAEGE
jgi:hypothetical protein